MLCHVCPIRRKNTHVYGLWEFTAFFFSKEICIYFFLLAIIDFIDKNYLIFDLLLKGRISISKINYMIPQSSCLLRVILLLEWLPNFGKKGGRKRKKQGRVRWER